jgi:proline dehydrogenase
MALERARAAEMGYDDPIRPTLADTHDNYDGTVAMLLERIAKGEKVEVMLATHNQQSIENALLVMDKQSHAVQAAGSTELNVNMREKVYFGQLLGMADQLTFNLGSKRYNAYKYVPYGQVREVLPYLIRRAQENGDLLGGSAQESDLVYRELMRRANPLR